MATAAQLAAQLADYDSKRVTATDALNDALTQYGVPEIRNTVSGLRTAVQNTSASLAGVDPSVTGRTSGSLVTEAQRQKLVSNEQAPIAEQLKGQTASLDDNSTKLNDAMTQATTLANNKVADWTNGRQALQSQYDDEYKSEQDAQAMALEKQKLAASVAASKSSGSSGSGGSSVDPAKAFLDYIAAQFKAAGGAGNKAVTRQQQDAWANSFFSANGVSNANRQQYWDLFNKTYNRTSDPTKDWRYAK